MKGQFFWLSIIFILFFSFSPRVCHAFVHIDKTYDVVIDIGHGGIDGGTSYENYLEKDINLAIGIKLYEELKKRSYHVGVTRLNDYALSDDNREKRVRGRHIADLRQRKLIADALEPRTFISLHVNWAKNSKRRGPIVIYQASAKSYSLARIVQSHLNEFYGVNNKVMRGNSYFLLKHLEMPSIIVELGFISNAEDRSILTDEWKQEELVRAIVEAFEEYLLLYPTNERSQYSENRSS